MLNHSAFLSWHGYNPMQHRQQLRTGMTIAYKPVENDRPYFGIIQHVELNADTQGLLLVRVLDRVGNGVLATIDIDQVVDIITHRSSMR